VSAHLLEREQFVARPVEEVFEFFSRAGNLELITPPWLNFKIDRPEPVQMGDGMLISYRLRLHGVPMRWVSRIEEWEPGRRFVDLQLRGPYRLWHHRHEFEAVDGGTRVTDHVQYELPFGPFGELAWALFVRRDLQRIFDHRRRVVAELLG
jgi:ligand-binding SRPBCC domain-containing protein